MCSWGRRLVPHPCFDPLTFCNLHLVMAHAALAPLLIPEPYCSLFVFSSFFPWAPGQWEEKVTVNIALKSSRPPIELLKMEQTASGWALPSCAGHLNCMTSNKCESLNVKDYCRDHMLGADNNLCYYTVDTILWYSIYSTCNSIYLLKKTEQTKKSSICPKATF